MIPFINRLTWFVSLVSGIVLCNLIIGGGSYYSFFDEGFSIIFWGAILGTFIKFFFFSKALIERTFGTSIPPVVDTITNASSTGEVTNDDTESTAISSDVSPDTPVSTKNNTSISPEFARLGANISSSTTSRIPEEDSNREPSVFSIWLHDFFSDRPLAKVGGILLFLGALFFLWLIFEIVGPVGKVLIGIAFGFTLIGIGSYLDTKHIITESRVLFGIGLAINYLTILSGRHLLGDTVGSGNQLFSDGFTTFALLLNTAFAVVVSLLYRSRVLLGFAFIFAYLTPFLIGSRSSSISLLVIYTTMVTVAIAVISYISLKMQDTHNTDYLQLIAVVGMSVLLSIASSDANSKEIIVIFIGLIISVLALAYNAYQSKISPTAIFIGSYFVIFTSLFVDNSFFLLPISIVVLFLLMGLFLMQGVIGIVFLSIFGGISFLFGLFGFWLDGAHSIGILLSLGLAIFALISYIVVRTASMMLALVGVIGFGILTLFGSSTHIGELDIAMLIYAKFIALLILGVACFFTIKLRDIYYYFVAIILSGILMIYPNTFESNIAVSAIFLCAYLGVSLFMPYILTRTDNRMNHFSFLLGSLPLSALFVTFGIYQYGQVAFSGLALGLVYIVLAGIYLAYAMFAGARFLPQESSQFAQIESEHKNILLIFFSVPLALFTLALAFVFGDIPGIMSLAWMVESTILYVIYRRLGDLRINIIAGIVFGIGVLKLIGFLDHLDTYNWLGFGILATMLVSIFSGLYILRDDESKNRTIYDILHIIGIICIGIGVSLIIPSTGMGWSIFGMAVFLLIVIPMYFIFGKNIEKAFGSIMFALLCCYYIGEFDYLIKDTIASVFIQILAMSTIAGIAYWSYLMKQKYGYMNLTIGVIGLLIITSMYVDYYLGTFAVSIYLTIIASVLIIRGIVLSHNPMRTIGLYIGTYALIKILGYDIWQGEYGTIVRVLALMIAGGVMIYLSQLYARYVSRTWGEEFGLSNLIPTLTNQDSINQNIQSSADEPVFSLELETELKDIVVSDISNVKFISQGGTSFTVKRAAILRIAKHIVSTLGKSEFKPNELQGAYNYITHNLESKLSEEELEALLSQFQVWIQEGGKVEFNYKK